MRQKGNNKINPKFKKLKKLKKNNRTKTKPTDKVNQVYIEESQRETTDIKDTLKNDYLNSELAKEPDTFVLYRIIGNDLYPRHKLGQARENLQFVLEHEQNFDYCEKRWIINRIINQDEEQKIIELLKKHNQPFIHIPFIEEEYKKVDYDIGCLPKTNFLKSEDFDNLEPEQRKRLVAALIRKKNNYIMNNNGARNIALHDGKSRAKWILPWDGNCFVTPKAWKEIYTAVTSSPELKYFIVPMTRVTDNLQLLSDSFSPDPVEEPQLIFRTDSQEEFNEQFCYGRRSKVELFWRLGIPGKWDRWKDEPWDQPRRQLAKEAYQFGVAGWVARMFSGMKSLEQDTKQSFKNRGLARIDAIINTVSNIDLMVNKNQEGINSLTNFNSHALKSEKELFQNGAYIPLINSLIEEAKVALTNKPYSVIDKKSLPPSNNPNDYWHPAPYWWPNPNTKDGLPYIWRDGKRVPGTNLYDPDSDKYDRTRLQRVFDDSIILALAWYFTEDTVFAQHGVAILERFYLTPKTRMNPHLEYAQVRMGRNKNKGFSTGIIEMKDLYYYLDAVRMFHLSGLLDDNKLTSFKEWLSDYLKWLIYSPQGKKERKALNNHGTYYDLQVAAIADFLGEYSLLIETLVRAKSRIGEQFSPDGSQPYELKRTTSAHYCCFNYQGWINIAKIANKWGMDLYNFEAPNGSSLKKARKWLLSYYRVDWPYKQIDRFDQDRFLAILYSLSGPLKVNSATPTCQFEVKARFNPHDGIRPYWNLGLSTDRKEQCK